MFDSIQIAIFCYEKHNLWHKNATIELFPRWTVRGESRRSKADDLNLLAEKSETEKTCKNLKRSKVNNSKNRRPLKPKVNGPCNRTRVAGGRVLSDEIRTFERFLYQKMQNILAIIFVSKFWSWVVCVGVLLIKNYWNHMR